METKQINKTKEINEDREFREKRILSLFKELDDYHQGNIYGLVWSLTAKKIPLSYPISTKSCSKEWVRMVAIRANFIRLVLLLK